ncbi:MAG: protein kinase, partial [Planctomycetota bacterium]|nr:protein kinase [Planctomycetota bacterium]
MSAASPAHPPPRRGDEASATSVDDIPPAVLVDLLSGAQRAADPSCRDYGERYRFVRVLGEGGQGVVVCARDLLLEREVAIKALKGPFDKVRERILEREARICGILEHPNILPTYDLCRDETGSPLLVMKKIEGVSLDDMLK